MLFMYYVMLENVLILLLLTLHLPYVFLYLEEVLEKNLKDSFNSSAIKYTL